MLTKHKLKQMRIISVHFERGTTVQQLNRTN